jgi:6-pyruvoyltetrahydropterin/6-carboxytetrahydropterin synthase
MYVIKVLSYFSGAHRLRSLHGKCEKLHGHNWKVEVSVAAHRLNKKGIVIDFHLLKKKVEEVLKVLDHTYLNDLPYFLNREPSSENIAKYVFDQLKGKVKEGSAVLKEVTAWESETACASYSGREV